MRIVSSLPLVAALVCPSLASARTLTATISIDDWKPVTIVRDVADTSAQETRWDALEGRACRALVDADDLGERAFVHVEVRCQDEAGTIVLESSPSVLMHWDDRAQVSMYGDGTPAQAASPQISMAVESSADGEPAQEQTHVVRSFFAEEGRASYAWGAVLPESVAFTCPRSVKVKGGVGGVTGEAIGRYRRGWHLGASCGMTTQDGEIKPVDVTLGFF